MKFWHVKCELTLDAPSADDAAEWLLNFCMDHDIPCSIDAIEDDQGAPAKPPSREGGSVER